MANRRGAFRSNIRSAVRGLWTGAIDGGQFFDVMTNAIFKGMTDAWAEGAAKCGVGKDELTPEERLILQAVINQQLIHILDYQVVIEEGSKANGGKLTPLLQRADLWVNQYDSVVNQAQQSACGNQKLKWVLHGARFTEEPCTTCLKLNGRVKRATYWQKIGVRPQNPPNPYLECEGWRCGCAFRITDEPLSKGPLPNLP